MDQEDAERSWSELPEDIVDLIYPLVSDQSPYLMALESVRCKFYHPVFEDTYYKGYPNSETMGRIASSNFGWLLANYGYSTIGFINPFANMPIIRVPILDEDNFEIFHFSSPPTSSSCSIIAVKNDNFNDTDIGIIKRGEKNWTYSRFSNCAFKTSFCNAVFFDGCYYFIGDKFNIGIFDVKTNDWRVCNKHLIPSRKSYLYRPIGMVEDNGGMLVVYESREHLRLYIARFDPSKMMWENLDCLGNDKVLYVSENASYLETTASKGMGNKIYFPKFYGENGVFYSLASKKYHSCDGRYCGEGPFGLVQPRFCTWIKPNYSGHVLRNSDDLEIHNFNGSDPIIIKNTDPILEGEHAMNTDPILEAECAMNSLKI